MIASAQVVEQNPAYGVPVNPRESAGLRFIQDSLKKEKLCDKLDNIVLLQYEKGRSILQCYPSADGFCNACLGGFSHLSASH